MKYRITRKTTSVIEAENEEDAKIKSAENDDGDWSDAEVENIEERYCVKCGKTSGLIEEEDMCYTCAEERGRE